MLHIRNIFIAALLVIIGCCQTSCTPEQAFSTTYHAHFFGLYKPKAKRAVTPQKAFATGFRGSDPFSRGRRKPKYNTTGDGYHTIVRHMRRQNSMGKPGSSKGSLFFKRKTRRRRSPAQEDKRIFGKYQRKVKRNHGKH